MQKKPPGDGRGGFLFLFAQFLFICESTHRASLKADLRWTRLFQDIPSFGLHPLSFERVFFCSSRLRLKHLTMCESAHRVAGLAELLWNRLFQDIPSFGLGPLF
jgi:hypothetical protein